MLVVPGWVGNFSFINKDKCALVDSFPHPNACLGHHLPSKKTGFIAILG